MSDDSDSSVRASRARLCGRRALVTGASRGIGLAVATALARHGAALILVARSTEALVAASRACAQAGAPEVAVRAVDLLDRRQLEALGKAVAAEADVLINNAGSAPSAPLERTEDAVFDEALALNVFAPFALARAALPAMAARGYGRVVNLASTAALSGFAYTSAYSASKHALLGLSRALAAEAAVRWPAADLSVNAVCPGFVDTPLFAESVERLARASGVEAGVARARLAALNPRGRLLGAEEVARAVVELVLEEPAQRRGRAVEFDY